MAIFGTKIDEEELAELIEAAISKEVSTSMNSYLKEFRSMVDGEVTIIKETASKVNGLKELKELTLQIDENGKFLNSMQEKFNITMSQYGKYIVSLEKENTRLQKEIRQRDSIIDRKNILLRKYTKNKEEKIEI